MIILSLARYKVDHLISSITFSPREYLEKVWCNASAARPVMLIVLVVWNWKDVTKWWYRSAMIVVSR